MIPGDRKWWSVKTYYWSPAADGNGYFREGACASAQGHKDMRRLGIDDIPCIIHPCVDRDINKLIGVFFQGALFVIGENSDNKPSGLMGTFTGSPHDTRPADAHQVRSGNQPGCG